MPNTVIQGYAEAARALIPQYEAISPEALYAPVLDYFPTAKSRVLDIGADTGRDTGWLARQGHEVLAAEPVAAFREAGRRAHGEDGITWLDGSLPHLPAVLALGQRFDLILVNAVLHHLMLDQQRIAFKRIAKMLEAGGRVVLSLRHGPFAASRPAYPINPEDVIEAAQNCGLRTEFQQKSGALQARNTNAGVTWTWLVFSSQP